MCRTLWFLVVLSLEASAAEVYVNEVNVGGLTNQTFEKVTVRLDEHGHVHIDAPGYLVKKVAVASEKVAKPEAIMTQKYFLVTEQTPRGMTEFDIDVFLNGTFFRTLKNGEDQVVADVTSRLKPGKNTVALRAKKNCADPMVPKSSQRTHVFRVILGEGSMSHDQVTLDKQLVTHTKTAAETTDSTQEFSFTTR